MKIAYVLTAIAQVASAHYFFDASIINGVASTKYIRESTRATKYNPIKFSSNPTADIRDGSYADGPDIRCNQGSFTNAGKTEVLTIAAGSEVRFRLGVGATMQHPGPGLVYMSKAPNDNVKAYDGSGDWFKIFQEGVCDTGADFTNKAWCTWDRNYITATIPENTPSGEYLVRVEHIGVHRSHVNQPEHFASCMQVKVTGGGSGTPGPLVKFPGAYKDSDAYANFSIYSGPKAFPFPGPAVWNGSSSSTSPVTTTKASAPTTLATTTKATTPTTLATTTKATTLTTLATTTKATIPTTLATTTVVAAPTTLVTSTKAATTKATTTTNVASASSGAATWAQCGGISWTGPTTCATGKCVALNQWYSQCKPQQIGVGTRDCDE